MTEARPTARCRPVPSRRDAGSSRKADKGRVHKMKRRKLLQAAGIGLAATAIAKPAIAQSMPELKWRMTCSWPKSLDTLYGAVELMAKNVAETTDNKFQIQVFAAGEIVPGGQGLDAAAGGNLERGQSAPAYSFVKGPSVAFCHSASYYYFGKDPTFAFGTSVAFGPNQPQNQAWMIHGGGMELLNNFYKKFNVIALMAGNTGCQMGGWFRKEINTVDDLKGLKFR